MYQIRVRDHGIYDGGHPVPTYAEARQVSPGYGAPQILSIHDISNLPTNTDIIVTYHPTGATVDTREAPAYPRPMNGMAVAITVMNWTLAVSGRLAI